MVEISFYLVIALAKENSTTQKRLSLPYRENGYDLKTLEINLNLVLHKISRAVSRTKRTTQTQLKNSGGITDASGKNSKTSTRQALF